MYLYRINKEKKALSYSQVVSKKYRKKLSYKMLKDVKIVSEHLIRKVYIYMFSSYYLTIKEKSNFTVARPDRYLLNEVIQISLSTKIMTKYLVK